MLGQIIILIILIAINAFFVSAEISVISLKEINIEKRAMNGEKKAKFLLEILNEPSKFLATIQIGVTLASFFTSASAAIGLSKFFEGAIRATNINVLVHASSNIAFVITTIIISFFSLLLGELIPKRIALKKSELIAFKSIGIIKAFNVIAKPLVWMLTTSTNSVVDLIFGKENKTDEQITEEEIRMMINVGEEKGIFRKAETEMINSIFQFDDTMVNDVMTPRPDIVALDVESSFEETIKVITEEKYSRIPVYKENIDNIIGILYTKDIIDYLAFRSADERFDLNNFIKKPFFVTEFKKIDLLLTEMQKKSVHISIVIDEYGTTAGLVTIEDMLEEIVGKIYDEYDEKDNEIEVKGIDEFEIDGGINMIELNELLDSHYSEESYDTVSGLILDTLGRFPEEGEVIKIDNYRFTIIEVDNMRIKKILIKKQGNTCNNLQEKKEE